MNDTHHGSCLCGAVRYEVHGGFESFFLCHCGRCRKGTGSAHAANLFASNAAIVWLSGESRVKTFRVAGTRHERSFCSECGSSQEKAKCANCQAELAPGAKFCPECGTKTEEAV